MPTFNLSSLLCNIIPVLRNSGMVMSVSPHPTCQSGAWQSLFIGQRTANNRTILHWWTHANRMCSLPHFINLWQENLGHQCLWVLLYFLLLAVASHSSFQCAKLSLLQICVYSARQRHAGLTSVSFSSSSNRPHSCQLPQPSPTLSRLNLRHTHCEKQASEYLTAAANSAA